VTVTDDMTAALLEDLGAAGVLELTARVGVMNLTARANVALGIRSQEYAASCGLPPLASRVAHT
jgi:alkylhydroperoxidase family enzyme